MSVVQAHRVRHPDFGTHYRCEVLLNDPPRKSPLTVRVCSEPHRTEEEALACATMHLSAVEAIFTPEVRERNWQRAAVKRTKPPQADAITGLTWSD